MPVALKLRQLLSDRLKMARLLGSAEASGSDCGSAGARVSCAWARVAAPVLLLALLDFVGRLHIMSWLELDHYPASHQAALVGALLGVLRDLLWLVPAYAAFAVWPGRWSRAFVHVSLVLSFAALVFDLLYFRLTLEHVEPIFFVNLNWLAVRSTLGVQGALLVLAVALGVWGLVRANAKLLQAVDIGTATPLARVLPVVLACVVMSPGVIARIPQLSEGGAGAERHLDQQRDHYLREVGAPIFAGLVSAAYESRRLETDGVARAAEFVPYTEEEASFLARLELLGVDQPSGARAVPPGPEIRRIAVLILESLPAAYLHTYNPDVPREATAFFDALLASHPHVDRFYTSSTPSNRGLNSLLLSRLRPDWNGGRPSLLSELKSELGFRSYYVRGVSKHYGNELKVYPKLFQMDEYIAFEELDERYDAPWRSSWGYNNRVVYEEGLRLLREHRDDKVIVVLKTIDLHPPTPFEGIPEKYLPSALAERGKGLFNALYWADQCLRGFFEALEAEGLYDEQTLVVVTSDHSPHPGVAYRETVPPEEYVRLGRLPLVFATPHPTLLAELDRERIASQIDLTPTLLHALGVSKPAGMVGTSLLGAAEPGRSLGFHDDTFYVQSQEGALRADLTTGDPENRALAKWLSNLDVDPAERAPNVVRADTRGALTRSE